MSDRYVQPLRLLIQFCFLLFMLWLGIRFFLFVDQIRAGVTPTVVRPAGIEGFLPISGLLGLSAWLRGMGINPVHPAAVILFVTVLLVALLLRRSFCSWICPVGTISECTWKGGFHLFKRNFRPPRWLDVSLRGVKYLLMAFFIYSIALAMPPEAIHQFIYSDYHKVADVRLLDFFLHISLRALLIILFLVALSLVLRNPFCRYICPYGALLGLVAWISPLRVTRHTDRCVSCGVCTQVCPSAIDVMHANQVTTPECIGCWRCVSHCRVNRALTFSVVGKCAVPGIVFAILVVALFWGGSIVGTLTGHWQTLLTPADYFTLLSRQ